MRKLKLEIENLKVDSFATAAGGAERGTVRGFDDSEALTRATRCFNCPHTSFGAVEPAGDDAALPADADADAV